MTSTTFDYSEENQGGFLSRMFNKITAPVRQYIAEIKEDLEDSKFLKLWEDEEQNELRQENIDSLLLGAYFHCNNLNDKEEINEYINNALSQASSLFHQHGKIKTSDVMAHMDNLTDEKKGELLQARHDFKNENNPVLEI